MCLQRMPKVAVQDAQEKSKRKNPVDIYSLIALFEEFSTARALTEVQKWFGGSWELFVMQD